MIKLSNARIIYYRQLQRLSDHVAIPQIGDLGLEMSIVSNGIKEFEKKIAYLGSRYRYLCNLEKDQNNESCIICKNEIKEGIITVCGVLKCDFVRSFSILSI